MDKTVIVTLSRSGPGGAQPVYQSTHTLTATMDRGAFRDALIGTMPEAFRSAGLKLGFGESGRRAPGTDAAGFGARRLTSRYREIGERAWASVERNFERRGSLNPAR